MKKMRENLRPGPKPEPRRAQDGTICPPGSEGSTVYRGIRGFRKVCKYGGHRKTHPGRCLKCRRARDVRRDAKRKRKAQKRAAATRWRSKAENIAKIARWSKRRNSRREQKDATAARMRRYRREAPKAHRALWIRYRGPIPSSHVIVFRGADRAVKIKNLEMVTRSEMMARNTIHRFPPELKQTIRALGKLKRTIRREDEGN